MSTNDPALITYDMAVSVLYLSYFLERYIIFFQLVEEFLLINAPASYYDRVQLMVSHMGHEGFTPYEMIHTLGTDYTYNVRRQPVILPLGEA